MRLEPRELQEVAQEFLARLLEFPTHRVRETLRWKS